MLVTWWADGWLAPAKNSTIGVAPVPHLGHPDTRVVEHGVLREQLVEAVPLAGVDHVAVLPEELVDLDEVDGLHAASAQLGVRAGSAAAWQPARYPYVSASPMVPPAPQ